MKKGAKRKGGRRAGGKAAAASQRDDAVAESPPPQESQPSQEAEEEAKAESPPPPQEELAESNENEEGKEDQKEEEEEAKADSLPQQDQEASKEEEAKGASSSQQLENHKAKDEEEKKKPARRGKRGRTSKKETEKKEEDKPAPRAKRARTAKPQEDEPEYFEEKRSLEDLWKAAFPVGTEWDQFDALYEFNWDFTNLEEAFEEGGKLHGKKVYVFGCTEPQLVPYKEGSKLVHVPAVVAIESPFPPSDKIGITSVQREVEEIIPMKKMKMDWVPYIPLEKRDRQVDRLKFQIFILGCTQRRAALKHLKEERIKKFEYCLPYFYQPFKEDELEQSTVVQIMFPIEPPVVCEFDWEMDELEEFTDDLIKEEVLPADQKDAFKEFVKEQVRAAKKANREAREARRKAIEDMSEETKQAFQSMKFYKFYPLPSPDTPDVSSVKSPFINRYYGKAHEVL